VVGKDAEPEVMEWLMLARAPGLGSAGLHKLLLRGGGAGGLLRTPLQTLRQWRVASAFVEAVGEWQTRAGNSTLARAAQLDLAQARDAGVALLWPEHPGWPPLLKEIPDPPLVLFIRGDAETLRLPQLAIVGSRRASVNGQRTATRLAEELARAGLCITSGLALGIDAAAHRGALEAGGRTVAVLGCGIDQTYPARHLALAGEICQAAGAVISEWPVGAPVLPANFPRRNRLISGLSLGVLVVEAAERSGSLVTARLALEQNREVFALPGSIHHALSRGTNGLIRQGAALIQNSDQVLEELGLSAISAGAAESAAAPDKAEPPAAEQALSEPDRALLVALGDELLAMDELVERTGMPVQALAAQLARLELEGLVHKERGGYTRSAPG